MANLYEINEVLLYALARADVEAIEYDGEITEATAEELDRLEMNREDKIQNTALYIKNIAAEIAMIKAEEKNLKERRVSLEKTGERISEWLKSNLRGEKRASGNFKISYRKSQAVEVSNVDLLPARFVTKKMTVMPIKTDIKKAILSGEEINGAVVIEKSNMVVK